MKICLVNIPQKVKDEGEDVPEDSDSDNKYDSDSTVILTKQSPSKTLASTFPPTSIFFINVERDCLFHPSP